jgi:RNA polymerase sigma factor (sigma-70 family)
MLTFQELYESYVTDVYHFALWLCGDSVEAEDITSETLIRAWTGNSKIHTETLKAYLFTIARNTYLEGHRKQKRQAPLEDVHTDPKPGPDQMVSTQLEIQQVRRFLQTFSEIDRTAFVMRVQHELPYEEIARALNLSLAAVKVHRVRKKLIATQIDKEF